MVRELNTYIISNYFKYILVNLLIFVGLIWISQILRIIELQYSITFQIFDIAITTLFALPSFISPLIPFLILIGSMMLNYKLTSSNEIIILKQYISPQLTKKLFQFIAVLTLIIYSINNEIISKKFYEIYKVNELEIRNNLKLGSPSENEFHIDDKVSIFFDKKVDEIFYEIDAIIYDENQFIYSKSVEIEVSKSRFNLVFHDGERLTLNDNEKSKTIFDKYTHTLSNNEYEELLMDKDHFNTFELLNHSERDFRKLRKS